MPECQLGLGNASSVTTVPLPPVFVGAPWENSYEEFHSDAERERIDPVISLWRGNTARIIANCSNMVIKFS